MNIHDTYSGKYLRASDLNDQPLQLQIENVVQETVGQGDKQEQKLVVYFKGEEKGLVLNKTNVSTIADMYGDETDDWFGKPVTLFPTQVDFAGKQVEAIRVRKKQPPKPAPRGKPAPAVNNQEFSELDE